MRFAAALIALRAECILFSFTSNRFYSTHTDLRFFFIYLLSLSASASHTWAWCVKPSRFNP
jgi:hypothetical protein